MKTEITLTLTKDYYILANVFQFTIQDLLLYYMSNISLITFLEQRRMSLFIQLRIFL
jgi:hypothetical protein